MGSARRFHFILLLIFGLSLSLSWQAQANVLECLLGSFGEPSHLPAAGSEAAAGSLDSAMEQLQKNRKRWVESNLVGKDQLNSKFRSDSRLLWNEQRRQSSGTVGHDLTKSSHSKEWNEWQRYSEVVLALREKVAERGRKRNWLGLKSANLRRLEKLEAQLPQRKEALRRILEEAHSIEAWHAAMVLKPFRPQETLLQHLTDTASLAVEILEARSHTTARDPTAVVQSQLAGLFKINPAWGNLLMTELSVTHPDWVGILQKLSKTLTEKDRTIQAKGRALDQARLELEKFISQKDLERRQLEGALRTAVAQESDEAKAAIEAQLKANEAAAKKSLENLPYSSNAAEIAKLRAQANELSQSLKNQKRGSRLRVAALTGVGALIAAGVIYQVQADQQEILQHEKARDAWRAKYAKVAQELEWRESSLEGKRRDLENAQTQLQNSKSQSALDQEKIKRQSLELAVLQQRQSTLLAEKAQNDLARQALESKNLRRAQMSESEVRVLGRLMTDQPQSGKELLGLALDQSIRAYLARPQAQSTEEDVLNTESLEAKLHPYFALSDSDPWKLKAKMEEVILKQTGAKELIYNKDFSSPLDPIREAKTQCYASTSLFEMIRMAHPLMVAGEDPVVILTNGHILSGVIRTPPGGQIADAELFGVEHTAAGRGEIQYGKVRELGSIQEPVLVLRSEDFLALEGLREVLLTQEAERFQVGAFERVAKQYGLDPKPILEKIEAIRRAIVVSGLQNGKQGHSTCGFGEAKVPSGDLRRQVVEVLSRRPSAASVAGTKEPSSSQYSSQNSYHEWQATQAEVLVPQLIPIPRSVTVEAILQLEQSDVRTKFSDSLSGKVREHSLQELSEASEADLMKLLAVAQRYVESRQPVESENDNFEESLTFFAPFLPPADSVLLQKGTELKLTRQSGNRYQMQIGVDADLTLKPGERWFQKQSSDGASTNPNEFIIKKGTEKEFNAELKQRK